MASRLRESRMARKSAPPVEAVEKKAPAQKVSKKSSVKTEKKAAKKFAEKG